MEGTVLIFHPWADIVERHILKTPPDLKYLQGCVGGNIETVPYFDSIEHNGVLHDCVAFCNETGKLDGLDLNEDATGLWETAVKRHRPDGSLNDALCGSVVVLYGDAEFMDEL